MKLLFDFIHPCEERINPRWLETPHCTQCRFCRMTVHQTRCSSALRDPMINGALVSEMFA